MKYVITNNNIIVTIDDKPYMISKESDNFNKLNEALKDFKPDYIVKQLVCPSEDFDKAIKLLKGEYEDNTNI